ncbi:MAG TPA: apolipoprotein N-acyltransferase [Pirellulales bacterium]|nr:apolipoprotein N-acyltransferase [Pirellulales bacterium]
MATAQIHQRPRGAKPVASSAPGQLPAAQGSGRRTLSLALAGSALLFAALPPWELWPLAWLAPVPWALLVRQPDLAGKRPYLALWFAGLAFWLPSLYWLCLAHPATSIGWVALCLYLACYLPMFVAIARRAVHGWRVPLIVAVPCVWTGLNLAQARLFSGFDMAAVGHTQYRWLGLIQIADLFGEYGVTFVVMFVAAAIARALPCSGQARCLRALVPAGIVVACVLGYGMLRRNALTPRPGPTITLVQGNIDTEIKFDPAEGQRVFDHYLELTRRAVSAHSQTDLIVWPETMFRYPVLSFTDDATLRPDAPWSLDELRHHGREVDEGLAAMARDFGAPLLIGVDTIDYGHGTESRFNSALMIDDHGPTGERYDKSHPVLFGEYVPLASRWPWLYRFTPLGSGIESGTRSPGMALGARSGHDARLSLSICYETVLPHVIRREVKDATTGDAAPDILMNLTNDGWFWGSHELDLHLICGVFRAVECRMPLLVAANTGFSAWVDGSGRIVERGPRHAPGWIVADVGLDNRHSLYLRTGDWFAGLCLLGCLAIVVEAGSAKGRRKQRLAPPA